MFLVAAAQEFFEGGVLLGCGGGVGCAGGGVFLVAAAQEFFEGGILLRCGGRAVVRPLCRCRRRTVRARISTNVAAALARGGTSSMGTTRRVAYAATDISRISDAVRAVTCMSCICTEISGTAEAIRSVADVARIAATEGTSALVRSLSAHAGLATANARADELIGTARLPISVNRVRIHCEGRLVPSATEEVVGFRIA